MLQKFDSIPFAGSLEVNKQNGAHAANALHSRPVFTVAAIVQIERREREGTELAHPFRERPVVKKQ